MWIDVLYVRSSRKGVDSAPARGSHGNVSSSLMDGNVACLMIGT